MSNVKNKILGTPLLEPGAATAWVYISRLGKDKINELSDHILKTDLWERIQYPIEKT